MRQTFRFLITAMIALILFIGQGLAAFSAEKMACCQKMTVQTNHACCQHNSLKAIKPVKSLSSKVQACFCDTDGKQALANDTYPAQNLKLVALSSLNSQPFQGLQLGDSGKPISLYWQFYPDQSRLYQQKNSWLL